MQVCTCAVGQSLHHCTWASRIGSGEHPCHANFCLPYICTKGNLDLVYPFKGQKIIHLHSGGNCSNWFYFSVTSDLINFKPCCPRPLRTVCFSIWSLFNIGKEEVQSTQYCLYNFIPLRGQKIIIKLCMLMRNPNENETISPQLKNYFSSDLENHWRDCVIISEVYWFITTWLSKY